MSAEPLPHPCEISAVVGNQWAAIAAHTSALVSTMGRYLGQVAATLAPASVDATDKALRNFAGYIVDHEPHIGQVAEIDRDIAEDYKVWLSAQTNRNGQPLAANTRRQRLGMLRTFFERIIEWDWPDAPQRNPFMVGDMPAQPEPLPKFLTDHDAARLMAATRAEPDPLRRLVVEILARTGLRVGELCDLAPDAVVRIGENHWLRIPVGKLHFALPCTQRRKVAVVVIGKIVPAARIARPMSARCPPDTDPPNPIGAHASQRRAGQLCSGEDCEQGIYPKRADTDLSEHKESI